MLRNRRLPANRLRPLQQPRPARDRALHLAPRPSRPRNAPHAERRNLSSRYMSPSWESRGTVGRTRPQKGTEGRVKLEPVVTRSEWIDFPNLSPEIPSVHFLFATRRGSPARSRALVLLCSGNEWKAAPYASTTAESEVLSWPQRQH